jgi:septal ring factor EnvC (AmiA/AmiB activator)
MHLVETTKPAEAHTKGHAPMNGNLKAWLVPAATAAVLLVLFSTGVITLKGGDYGSLVMLTTKIETIGQGIAKLQTSQADLSAKLEEIAKSATQTEKALAVAAKDSEQTASALADLEKRVKLLEYDQTQMKVTLQVIERTSGNN